VSTKIYDVNESFVKIGPVKALLYLRGRWIPSHTCHVRGPAEFDIREQHISCWTFVRFVNTGTRQAALALCVWMKSRHFATTPRTFFGLCCIKFFCVLLLEDASTWPLEQSRCPGSLGWDGGHHVRPWKERKMLFQ